MANPQILYTPQQQMGYGGYSVPCRTGNWAEDEYLGALQVAKHVEHASNGMLTSQQLGSTLGAALAPARLAPAPADGFVKYGDAVMLSAALGGVLAVDSTKPVELNQEGYTVTRTPAEGGVACTRTAWTVVPIGSLPPTDALLRIGDRFALCVEGGDGAPLYLQSERYTLTNQNYSPSPGLRAQGCCAVKAQSADTAWEVKVLDPTDLAQMGSVGEPVPANTFVSLVHINSCTALCTNTTGIPNKYGGEYEVTAFTDTPITKGAWGKRNGAMLGNGNHWAFTTSDVAEAPAAEAAPAEA